MQQVFPEIRECQITDLYADATRKRRHERPWIILSMISSADGAVSIDGTSGGLGGPGDRAVFRYLRSLANGVLVGAQTVRSESYSPLPAHQTLTVVSQTSDLGSNADRLTSAGNTVIARGAAREICSSLEGDVWILEGGPSLNAQMLEQDCVDEVCLTVSPRFVAGTSGRIIAGHETLDGQWTLAHIAHDDGFVFLRYLRTRSI